MDKATIKSKLKKVKILRAFNYYIRVEFLGYLKYFKDYLLYYCLRIKTNIDIELLKDIKKGQSCIIVGNGPSCLFSDLDKIAKSGIDSFGANRIFNIFDKTIWRPTYYSLYDTTTLFLDKSVSCDEFFDNLRKENVSNFFLIDQIKKYVSKRDGMEFLKVISKPGFFSKSLPIKNELDRCIIDLGNVTLFSMQIAIYMGYSTIYLYGMDNSYKKYIDDDGNFIVDGNVSNYVKGIKKFEEQEKEHPNTPRNSCDAYYDRFSNVRAMNNGYRSLLIYTKTRNIQIINLTHEGHLNTFSRLSFNDIF